VISLQVTMCLYQGFSVSLIFMALVGASPNGIGCHVWRGGELFCVIITDVYACGGVAHSKLG